MRGLPFDGMVMLAERVTGHFLPHEQEQYRLAIQALVVKKESACVCQGLKSNPLI